MTVVGNICEDCVERLKAPADDAVIETYDDPDGEALWKYRREQEDRKEPVDYQEMRRRAG